MRKILTVCWILLLAAGSRCNAEGLGTLIELGRSQAEIQKQYEKETRAFEVVKSAIAAGAIKKGMDKAHIRGKYGDPVAAVDDLDGKREDWIYKPAQSSFFEGARATLVFTQDGILDDMRTDER